MFRKSRLATGLVISALVALGAVPAPATAATPVSGGIDAAFQKPKVSCADDEIICFQGTLNPYGTATFTYLVQSFEPIEGTNEETCANVTAVLTASTASGDLVTNTESVACFPGHSPLTPGTAVSFGNPVLDQGTWTADPDASTGVFAGMTGSGTYTLSGAGARIRLIFSGTLD